MAAVELQDLVSMRVDVSTSVNVSVTAFVWEIERSMEEVGAAVTVGRGVTVAVAGCESVSSIEEVGGPDRVRGSVFEGELVGGVGAGDAVMAAESVGSGGDADADAEARRVMVSGSDSVAGGDSVSGLDVVWGRDTVGNRVGDAVDVK